MDPTLGGQVQTAIDHSRAAASGREAIRSIAINALTLPERIELFRRNPSCFRALPLLSEQRLLAWERSVAANNPVLFERRLRWEGLNRETAAQLLGEVNLTADYPTPAWAERLFLVLSIFEPDGTGQHNRPLQDFFAGLPANGHPLLAPLIMAATEELKQNAANVWNRLPTRVQQQCQRQLSEELALLCQQIVKADGEIGQKTALVQQLTQESVLGFFKTYPVAARLISTRIGFWVTNIARFLNRLERDRAILESATNAVIAIEGLKDLSLTLSDSHHCGQQTVVAHFSSGKRIVYKPKNLALDVAWSGLVRALNETGHADLKFFWVLDQGDYGWVEFIESAPCLDVQSLTRYYRRMGVLLGLMHLLGGSDCHRQNIITASEHPVLIDLETLLSAPFHWTEPYGRDAVDRAQAIIEQSVLSTGLLPEWVTFTRQGDAIDPSGLGGHEQWCYGKQLAGSYPPIASCLPHQAIVEQGFREVYLRFLEKQPEPFEGDGLMKQFLNGRVRLVPRATSIYARLQRASLQRGLCRCGLMQSLFLDRMAGAYLKNDQPPATWPMLNAEHQAVTRGDIPLFLARITGRSIEADSETIAHNALPDSAWERLHRSIMRLSMADCSQQLRYIDASFSACYAMHQRRLLSKRRFCFPQTDAAPAAIESDLKTEAIRIAAAIEDQAIRSLDGSSVCWNGFVHQPETLTDSYRTLPFTLYSGATGIGLFLAAVAVTTGEQRFCDLARAAITPLCQRLKNNPLAFVHYFSVGGMFGLGSIVYALLKFADLLEMPELIEDASRCAVFLDARRMQSDDTFDLYRGCAGAILAMAQLYHCTSDPDHLETVALGARHLVAEGFIEPNGAMRSTHVLDAQRCDLGYGVSGIALALMVAWRQTGDETFHTKALATLRGQWQLIEQALDRSDSERPRPVAAMIAGMLLARKAILAIDSVAEITSQHDALTQLVFSVAPSGAGLHGGEPGLADILFEVGRHRELPHLATMSRAIWRRAIDARDTISRNLIPESPDGWAHPGLMSGTSGIGYAMLRAIDHDARLPSLLRLGE